MRSHGKDIATSVGGRGDGCIGPAGFVLEDRCLMCVHSLATPAAVSSCQPCPHKWHPALVLLRICISSHMGTAVHCPYPGPQSPLPLYATQIRQSSLDLFQSIFCFRLTYQRLKNPPFFFPLGTKSFIAFLQTSQHCLDLSGKSVQLNGF